MFRNCFAIACFLCADANEYVSFTLITNTVVKFSDVALAEQLAESFEGATLLGDADCKYRFTELANVCTFCHKAQTAKIHIGTASYCY